MTSLLDIGRLSKTVSVRDIDTQVFGLSGRDFLTLLNAFPELRKVLSTSEKGIEVADLIAQAPNALGMIIAAALGHPGDPDYVALAEVLSMGEQIEIVKAAWELSFPGKTENFMKALVALVSGQRTGRGWDQGTQSPEPSKP